MSALIIPMGDDLKLPVDDRILVVVVETARVVVIIIFLFLFINF